MQSLQQFDFGSQAFRAVTIDGDPWFVANDVRTILGYVKTSHMTRLIDDEDKGAHLVGTLGGSQEVIVISEPALYSVISKRKSVYVTDPAMQEQVRAFQRWVSHTVLPSIRKTGSYSVRPVAPALAMPTSRELAQLVIAEADRADAAEREIEILEDELDVAEDRLAIAAPKAAALDALCTADGDLSIAGAAKELRLTPAIKSRGLGRDRLVVWLRDQGWIVGRTGTEPSQNVLERDWMATSGIKTGLNSTTGRPYISSPVGRVTMAGVVQIRKMLLAEIGQQETTLRAVATITEREDIELFGGLEAPPAPIRAIEDPREMHAPRRNRRTLNPAATRTTRRIG